MDFQAFNEAYNRLNEGQRKAVDTIDGPVMVVAGPGTGKTTVLTLRIANILHTTDTPPSGILAITYTDAGVKAMRTKLRTIIGPRAHEVGIFTFHGFAAAMIAEYPDHFIHLRDRRRITDIEQETLIRDILTGPQFADIRPLGKPDHYLSEIIRTISDAKRDTLTPDDVRAFALNEIERIKNDESSISTRGVTKGRLKADAEREIVKCERTKLFADVYASYEAAKHEQELMDFDDLIIELITALEGDELLRRLVQERFLYLLVDEHQDTNDAQNLIIRIIAEFFEIPNVFIVGDEKQAIYRFQGASVENFLALRKRWPTMVSVSLDTNYRSHQSLLDAGFAMIEHNYDGDEHRDLRVPLTAASGEGARPIEVATAENASAMERYLVDSIREVTEREPDATVAVITRRNRELERVLQLLEQEGIPVSSERSIDIFAHPVGRTFFDLAEFTIDPTRLDALLRTMVAGCWDLSIGEVAELAKAIRSGARIEWEEKLPGLARIQKQLLTDDPLGCVVALCRESGLAEQVALNPASVQVWRGVVALAESIVRDRELTDPADLLRGLLAYRQSAERRTVKVAVGVPDSIVSAMTAHGSKGLEFDYVFLPYATESAWIGKARGRSFSMPNRRASTDDISDLRRLFYVALTRARKHAVVLAAEEESDGTTQLPVRFIDELPVEHTSTVRLPYIDPPLPTAHESDVDSVRAQAITDLAKRVLTTSGLSVTALNHFVEDPKTFLLESILKMPQAPSASAEKGSAMHAAFDRIWSSGERDSERIEKVIIEAVDGFLAASLLASAEKDAVRRELHANAPKVAAALSEHFETDGTIYSEKWVEAEFRGTFEGVPVTIPIHGKLDAIIEHSNTVEVFDYKTRQGMSPAAIRGETKSSDGKYFRQLIFYTLLISGNDRYKGKAVNASLVFLSPDKKDRCPITTVPVTKEDLDQVQGEMQELIEFVWSGKLGTVLN
ncbi:MAG: ATP-dependent DNA helicase [Candidatus Paceibacterota bacterium]